MDLSYLLQKAFDGLGSLIWNEFWLIKGLDKDIESLRSTLSTILAEVVDAEKKQLKDQALKDWLAKLKHAAYDVDDVLDEFQSEVSKRELEAQDPVTKKMRSYLSVSISNPILFPSLMAHKVKDVRERLYAIAEQQSKFHLIAGAAGIFDTEVVEKTHSWVIQSEVYGRNEDKEILVKKLLDVGREGEGELSVIPILGMGGLGKTTLAQLVYNDAEVMEHFDLQIWVCVSDDFNVKSVIKAIIDSPAIRKCNSEELDSLHWHLRQELRGRKFLLVLDDVWEEHPQKWEQLRSFLQSGAMGSKIIVTTRSSKVALFMGTLPPCHLGRLSDDDCWTLFKQRAFGRGQEQNPNLVALGKEIVKKCGGVPLAAKALGSMMRFRTSESQWEFIKEDEIWNLPEEENGILPALRLSYYHLSPQLKQCFAYCSNFPKDHQIKTHELILLWMGEGFIQPTKGRQEMEDTGREYFTNLLWRSFFQEPKEDDNGNIVSCKMHDLMHDLAVSVSGEICSIIKDGNITSIPNECRHLSLVASSSSRIPTIELVASSRVEKLRTLLMFGYQIRMSLDISILPHLRVLDLCSLKEISKDMLNSISGLKLLRYLHLNLYDKVSSLPESLSQLHNLQSLKLTNSRWLTELPKDMRRMISLRHLQMTDCGFLTHVPANMGELKFLQTLPAFIVGEEESGCNIRELQELKLGGELELRKLENVRGRENAVEAALNEKANLRSLRFSWSDKDIDDSMRSIDEHTLEGLQPHKNLKRLTVFCYGGEHCPRWMSDSFVLRNLAYLSLSCCKRCKELPSLGQLPLLKSLLIFRMDVVNCIGSHFYGERAFPSLEDLTFRNMPNLEEWSSPAESNHGQPQAFPRLQKLTLSGCPKLTAIPACFPSLSSLTIEMFQGDSLPVGLFQNQTHLSTLTLNCRKLKSLPRELGNLAALQKLHIEQCDDLTSLRLEGGFTSLRALSIFRCDKLESFVGELHHLTSLESLIIGGCRQLGSLPEGMEHLTAITSLCISNCRRVTCLPEGLKHARTLKDLRICYLPSFATLPEWIGCLSSLQSLYIESCQNLVAFPFGLQHLTNLKSLTLDDCPQLEKRCEKHIGEDWVKISHIRNFQIICRKPKIERLQI